MSLGFLEKTNQNHLKENRCTKSQSAAVQIDGITQTFVVSVKKIQNLEK